MQSFCRLCAAEKQHLIPIFSKNTLDISSKIINLLNITINPEDYLPLTICKECFSQLTLFNVFKTNCLEAQEVLGFIFIDKNPEIIEVEEEVTNPVKSEDNVEIIECTVDEDEDEVSDDINVEQIEHKVEEDPDADADEDEEEQIKLIDVIYEDDADENDADDDDADNYVVSPEDVEMIDEEYLNDDNEKDVSEDETYVIEVLEQNHSDSENEDSKDFIDSLKETNQTFSDKDSGLFCNECSTFFEKRKKYEIHFKENHKTKLYFTCQVCTKQFDLYRSYTRHVNAHATGPTFKCDVCDKSFIQKNGLKQHRLSHLDEKQYKCDQCDRSFKQNSSLYNHKSNVHNENIKHICDFCHKIFATAPVLRDHIKSKHSHTKDVICDICGVEYSSRSAMFYHKLSHKPKMHQCEICFLKFKTNGQLKQHRLKNQCVLGHILEEELFSCDYNQCFKKFITQTDLDLHLIKHHNDTFSFEA